LDVFRKRLEFPELRRRVIERAQYFDAKVLLIEDKGSGTQLIQTLCGENCARPIAIQPEFDKVTRMHGATHLIEAGQVFLPTRAPWLEAFKHELLAFPNGRHDDQVDAFSQGLSYLDRRRLRWVFS
jgi:predicted phage terminase large subunit-like protein